MKSRTKHSMQALTGPIAQELPAHDGRAARALRLPLAGVCGRPTDDARGSSKPIRPKQGAV
jgi:hypothetical protein